MRNAVSEVGKSLTSKYLKKDGKVGEQVVWTTVEEHRRAPRSTRIIAFFTKLRWSSQTDKLSHTLW